MEGNDRSVWKICVSNKNTYFITMTIAMIIAIVLSISKPNTYISQEVLIVESSAPMNLLIGADQYAQAILEKSQTSPIANDAFAYKNVFHSSQIINSIKKTIVKDSNGKSKTLEQHLKENYKRAWWDKMFEKKVTDEIITDRLKYEIKLKTKVIVVQYEDEDKNVSSQITNAMTSILNQYFTDLNLRRNQPDMEYYKERRKETGLTYKESADKYSAYHDSHMGTSLHSEQTHLEFLRNDMNNKYEEYSKACVMYKRAEMFTHQQQLVSTRIKTSQTYTSKNGAMWMANISVSLFLAIIGTSWYILLKTKYGKNR